ncbi:hypothetical protein BJ944DRAFT_241068 [Cunninghamella echinulata]|nr:hypothetical protein BJ944DRAFT_241068 [Cunninghamella echinulata]
MRTEKNKKLKFFIKIEIHKTYIHHRLRELNNSINNLKLTFEKFHCECGNSTEENEKDDKPLSTIKYKYFYGIKEKLKVNLPRDLFDLETYGPYELRISHRIIKDTSEQLKTVYMLIGLPSELKDEVKTKRLIGAFIVPCIQLFNGSIRVIDLEKTTKRELIGISGSLMEDSLEQVLYQHHLGVPIIHQFPL